VSGLVGALWPVEGAPGQAEAGCVFLQSAAPLFGFLFVGGEGGSAASNIVSCECNKCSFVCFCARHCVCVCREKSMD